MLFLISQKVIDIVRHCCSKTKQRTDSISKRNGGLETDDSTVMLNQLASPIVEQQLDGTN